MNFLRTVWPTPFKIEKGKVGSFIIQLVIFVVICVLATWLFSFLGGLIPKVGFIFSFIAGLMDIYGTVGIVLCFLKFFGVVK